MYLKWAKGTGAMQSTIVEHINTIEYIRDLDGVAIVLNGRELDRFGHQYPYKQGCLFVLYNAIIKKMSEGATLILYADMKRARGL